MRDRLIEIFDKHTWLRFLIADINIERLADILLEEGVIVPPVKVGQTVYSYCDGLHRILPYFVESIDIAYLNEKTNCYGYIANCVEESDLLDSIDFECDDIGQTVFLTEEEAEKELAERNTDNA